MEVKDFPIHLSPSNKNAKTRNAIYKLMKRGSPKVRDIVREHCKQKWKENRKNFQNKGRKLSLFEQTDDEAIREEIKSILKNYTDKDLPGPENIDKFLKLFDLSDQEIEEAELFDKNDEEITKFKVERLLSQDVIVCPICETGALSSNSENHHICNCDNCFVEMQLDYPLNILENKIRSSWDGHSKFCTTLPKFRLDYSPQRLNMYCTTCGHCSSIF